jgi:hypothetical protein
VFSFVGNVPDLAHVKLVCKNFHAIAGDENRFGVKSPFANTDELSTTKRFTCTITTAATKMVKDDNRLGVCPIAYNPGVWFYKGNRPDYWFACMIRWVRSTVQHGAGVD